MHDARFSLAACEVASSFMSWYPRLTLQGPRDTMTVGVADGVTVLAGGATGVLCAGTVVLTSAVPHFPPEHPTIWRLESPLQAVSSVIITAPSAPRTSGVAHQGRGFLIFTSLLFS